MRKIVAIDSHTGGEPTRVIMSGAPSLNGATLPEMRDDFLHTHTKFRTSVINEPRGSEIIVGALLLPPSVTGSTASVIYFNNVGVLNMCGHGTIGLVRTLAYTGQIKPGLHRLDTPAGTVETVLHTDGSVTVRNVPSYRWRANVPLTLSNGKQVSGDIAWGGNWFYICHDHGLQLHLQNLTELQDVSLQIRRALQENGMTGANGALIDHVELTGAPNSPVNNARNFVMCPGGAFDRSPCGTGTSAKLACLVTDGKLAPGDIWRQESITGSVFTGSVIYDGDAVIPSITGSAFITAEINLVYEADDPLANGIDTLTPMC